MSDGFTVGEVIANAARARPHDMAAHLHGRAYSFADLDRAGTAVAGQMVDAGIAPGDVALVVSETSFDLLAHFVGCARSGAIFVAVNPATDPGTLERICEVITPSVALVSPRFDGSVEPSCTERYWFDADVSATSVLPRLAGTDPHIAYLTSGSTGVPKAVLVSHATSVLRSHPGAQLEPRGPALCPYPLFHMAGWTISLQQWHARAPVVFVAGTDADTLVGALRDHDIERFNAVPALWIRLAEHLGDAAPGSFPALRFADTGTSPTSPELLETIGLLAPNAVVRVFYGSSEAGNVASLGPGEVLTKPGRCGTPSLLTQVDIGPGDELLVRGPLLFDGYLGQPEATAEALRDGWFHTGDCAAVDDEGYLSITGRLGNLIRSGGEAIAPDVVEGALRMHPDVVDVAVFAIPDASWGELVAAAVVADRPVTLDELRAHLGPDGSAPLAAHQHPRRLLLVDELPRTAATEQVDRGRLRALAAAVEAVAQES